MHPAITRYTTLQDQATDCVQGLPTARVVDWLRPKTHVMRNVIWLCDHKQCHAVARRFFAMSAEQFDEYELGAMLEAGRSAGGYLDEIGKTDLALLSAEEWTPPF
jgi:hypothetical protein